MDLGTPLFVKYGTVGLTTRNALFGCVFCISKGYEALSKHQAENPDIWVICHQSIQDFFYGKKL